MVLRQEWESKNGHHLTTVGGAMTFRSLSRLRYCLCFDHRGFFKDQNFSEREKLNCIRPKRYLKKSHGVFLQEESTGEDTHHLNRDYL